MRLATHAASLHNHDNGSWGDTADRLVVPFEGDLSQRSGPGAEAREPEMYM